MIIDKICRIVKEKRRISMYCQKYIDIRHFRGQNRNAASVEMAENVEIRTVNIVEIGRKVRKM